MTEKYPWEKKWSKKVEEDHSDDINWDNTKWALIEIEKANNEYLDKRQKLYNEIKPGSGDAERQYANNETEKAYRHSIEVRKKIFEELRKKNREARK